MTFHSRRDPLFLSIIYIVIIILLGIFVMDAYKNGIAGISIWAHVLDLAIIGLLIWMFHGTKYIITNTHIKYYCGPLRGRVRISNIKAIIKNKTLWAGYRPATARKGLVIKFNKFDEIYFSPQRADEFITELLKVNKNIKITEK